VIGTWRAAQAEAPDLTEAEAREALAVVRQGGDLQDAEPPYVPRPSDPPGEGLSRRAPGDRVPGAVGPGARHHARQPARPGQRGPPPDAGTAPRVDLRAGRAGAVADAHPPQREALHLLCKPSRAEGHGRRLHGPAHLGG
jgi:hypothetical protein